MDKMNNHHPPRLYEEYKSTIVRAPGKPIHIQKEAIGNLKTPLFGEHMLGPLDHDLTRNSIKSGEPIGERMVLEGKVSDGYGRPIANTLVEVWQANAAGRYVHKLDQHNAPLDPNFLGAGRCLTDVEGNYKFYTIKPGAYPWGNHFNAWRPMHIHFSVFGTNITQRLITQMYFPGDPLLTYDPIFKSVPENARNSLISEFDLDLTESGFALGYRFDIVLSGRSSTPFEH